MYKEYIVKNPEEMVAIFGLMPGTKSNIAVGNGTVINTGWYGFYGRKFRHDFKKRPVHQLTIPTIGRVKVSKKMCYPVKPENKKSNTKPIYGIRVKYDNYKTLHDYASANDISVGDALDKIIEIASKKIKNRK